VRQEQAAKEDDSRKAKEAGASANTRGDLRDLSIKEEVIFRRSIFIINSSKVSKESQRICANLADSGVGISARTAVFAGLVLIPVRPTFLVGK
jgi:hypothetical protein